MMESRKTNIKWYYPNREKLNSDGVFNFLKMKGVSVLSTILQILKFVNP